jgi:ATP phosphoribosyltransferase regulatory subunit
MTPQIARIAATRLINAPRPLRLSYAGEVLRVQGGRLRPERQLGQAGIELIGAPGPAADAEVIVLLAQSLIDLGLTAVSIDLNLPTLVPLALAGLEAALPQGLRVALDRKDMAAVTAEGGAAAGLLNALIEAAGPADRALQRMAALALPKAAALERDRLAAVVALVQGALPGLTLTVDPVENRGFEYHTGIAFTVFTRGYAGELGRGGRYVAHGETATGATLYTDNLLDVIAGAVAAKRVFLPAGTPATVGARLRSSEWITVAGLEPVADAAGEALRLGCHFMADGDNVIELSARGLK